MRKPSRRSSKKITSKLPRKPIADLPVEIIQEIISSFPVKTLLSFKSVSKPWLSLLSEPSFVDLHRNRTNKQALLISAHDDSNFERYFFSASHHGGTANQVLTINANQNCCPETQHLNGLVLFASENGLFSKNFAFLFNPATRQVFKLPTPCPKVGGCYMFGFDESSNQHKVLHMTPCSNSVGLVELARVNFAIFYMSDCSWRKINSHLLDSEICRQNWYWGISEIPNVCVNSVIYFMLPINNKILGFDLRTEYFSITRLPKAAYTDPTTLTFRYVNNLVGRTDPTSLINIKGYLGVISYKNVNQTNFLDIWMLKDSKNHGWVKRTIVFPSPWWKLGYPYASDTFQTGEIIFSPRKVHENSLTAFIYDMDKRTFITATAAVHYNFECAKSVKVGRVMGYVESIMPLPKSYRSTPSRKAKEIKKRKDITLKKPAARK